MKITEIHIPKHVLPNGIEDINMSRLNDVVILVGKNGAGKSRILNKIYGLFKNKPPINAVNGALGALKKINADYNENLSQLRRFKAKFEDKESVMDKNEKRSLENKIIGLEKNIRKINEKKIEFEEIAYWQYIITDRIYSKYNIVPFVPKDTNLTDPNSFTKQQLIEMDVISRKIGIDQMAKSALATIQVIQDRWFNSSHHSAIIQTHDKEIIVGKYRKLQLFINQFLNTELGRDENGNATLFNFPIGNSFLSDGQKILIQFCIALLEQGLELKDIILFLDEPENHLHPSIIIETIDRLRILMKDGQIWIATHSIPLLAHFDPINIWYVEENKVSFAGKLPEKVMFGLLGKEDEILKLQDFLNLPAELAISNFATECLKPPLVVWTKKTDIQSTQANQLLTDPKKLVGKIKILDYGAGKGRVISNILEQFNGRIVDFGKVYDYYAFDIISTNNKICKEVIQSIYNNDKTRFYNNVTDLNNSQSSKSFDYVLLCNVLHEIHPKEWLKLFNENGDITRMLKDDGFVIIIEDYQMPTGEKAHENGFLLLDIPQLKDLFKITESNFKREYFETIIEKEGRLKAHKIHRSYLTNIDSESRIKSLKTLSYIAKNHISQIREKGANNYSEGKKHGFWVQQFANAELALQQFNG